jgi:hypothetical protein
MDLAQTVLPGLRNVRAALTAAGTPRFWHNAIEGKGAFAPCPVVIFGVPPMIFAGMAWRVALRHSRALKMDPNDLASV